ETGLHGLDAQRKQKHVDAEGKEDDAPSPVGDDVQVDPLEDEEEDLADKSPEAEVEERLERDALAVEGRGVDVAQNVDGLGTSVDSCLCVTAGVAERDAEDGNVDGSLGRRPGAKTGALDRLRYVEFVVERSDGSGAGRVGKEDGGEVGVGGAGPVEGAVESISAGDLLGGE